MGIFTRFSDIINSNLNAMLDKAENPEKMIKLIIAEMDQTLADVRSASVDALTDKKELKRKIDAIKKDAELWQEKAEIALRKDREDLAKSALQEKTVLIKAAEEAEKELASVESAIEKLEIDISRLQAKRNEAVARRDAMVMRHQTIQHHTAVKKHISSPDFSSAITKFDAYERRIDHMEAELEAMDLGRNQPLKQEIDHLVEDEKIESELAELKQQVAQKDS